MKDRVVFLEHRVRGLETDVKRMHKPILENQEHSLKRSEIMHEHFGKIMDMLTQKILGRPGGAAPAPVQES